LRKVVLFIIGFTIGEQNKQNPIAVVIIFVFSVGMEDTTLTLEQIEHVPQIPREFSSVRIREFDDSTANPEPIAQDEEADQLLEEFLSPSKLVGFDKF